VSIFVAYEWVDATGRNVSSSFLITEPDRFATAEGYEFTMQTIADVRGIPRAALIPTCITVLSP
jgi:hypothetical protein